uniref:hypothetical protein n=1 Tax=Brucella anthropi TaxID=529 RepID=UPI0023621E22
MTNGIGARFDAARNEVAVSGVPARRPAAARLRRALCSGASVLALAVAGLGVATGTVLADPSITYSGNVTPAPAAGTTDWTSPDALVIGDGTDGSVTIAGGAT